jgi:hypothetical protein
MNILLIANLPSAPEQMNWIESQPADLIIVAGVARADREPNPSRSWVLRFPVAAGNLEWCGGDAPEWVYALRHVRLAVNQSGGQKSIPVVFLPSPTLGFDDDWYAAAKKKCVDASAVREPWALVTVSPPEKLGWPDGEDILTLSFSDVIRPAVAVCGFTRVLKIRRSERRRVWIDSGANSGPIPHHAWIIRESPAGPLTLRDAHSSTSHSSR